MRKKKNKMGIARRISGLISGNVGVFFAGDGRYRRLMRNRRGKKERRRGIFAIREREPIQWCVYAARNCWASICEINEFHNVLTTFTVKTKSRLRG